MKQPIESTNRPAMDSFQDQESIMSFPNLPLLVFAHQPEARAFLERDRLTLVKDSASPPGKLTTPYKHFQGENYHLLITHGGAERSLFAVTRLLIQYRYQTVINLGFVGALAPAIKLGEVSVINISYGMREQKPMKPFFESFALSGKKNQVQPLQTIIHAQAQKLRYPLRDVLSITNPLVLPRSKAKLLPFAPLVDQELWWIGFACSHEHIPLAGIKIVSDLANQTTKLTEIKEHQSTLALKLYEAFYALTGISKKEQGISPVPSCNSIQQTLLDTLLRNKNFYFTATQKKIFSELAKKITKKTAVQPSSISGTANEKIPPKLLTLINTLTKKENLKPKARTTQLINTMNELCYPQAAGYHRHVLKQIVQAKRKGFRLEVDSRLEEGEIGVSFRIKNLQEWKKYLKELPDKEVTELFRILGGEVTPSDLKNNDLNYSPSHKPNNSQNYNRNNNPKKNQKKPNASTKIPVRKPTAIKH